MDPAEVDALKRRVTFVELQVGAALAPSQPPAAPGAFAHVYRRAPLQLPESNTRYRLSFDAVTAQSPAGAYDVRSGDFVAPGAGLVFVSAAVASVEAGGLSGFVTAGTWPTLWLYRNGQPAREGGRLDQGQVSFELNTQIAVAAGDRLSLWVDFPRAVSSRDAYDVETGPEHTWAQFMFQGGERTT